MNKPDFRAAYRSEALDLLTDVEALLLSLEERPGDTEACHALFRAMHTIKGSGAMFGFDQVAQFTHHVETLLDQVRKETLPVTPSLIDLILASKDHIRALLDAEEAGAVVAGDRGEQLIASMHGLAAADAQAPPPPPPPPRSSERFHVALRPPRDFFASGQDPALLIAELAELGECEVTARTDELPAPVGLDPTQCYLAWDIIVSTNRGLDAVTDVFLFVPECAEVRAIGGAVAGAPEPPSREAPVRGPVEAAAGALASFGIEALDAVAQVEGSLSSLDTSPEHPERDSMLRQAQQSLRDLRARAEACGGAGIAAVAGLLERGVDRWATRGSTRREDMPLFMEAVDWLKHGCRDAAEGRLDSRTPEELLRRLGGQGEPRSRDRQPAPETGTAASAEASVRVRVDKMDELIDLVGEVALVHAGLTHRRALDGTDGGDDGIHRLEVLLRQLQDSAMALRMIPISGVFQRMRRLVRDLSRDMSKPVELVISGEDTEVDRSVVEQLTDPLVHLIRNSIDHGLESASERQRLGKPDKGRLELRASQSGGEVQIAVVDDGRGLNREKILAKARERGLCGPDEEPDPHRLHAFIFEPGFSTAGMVTNLSGRGVGMDVVNTNIRALRGRISTASNPGRGTRFTLHIPLTLAILDVMLIKVASLLFAIPVEMITEILRPTRDQITDSQIEDQEVVRVRGHLVPVLRLQRFYGVGEEQELSGHPMIALECDGQRLALPLDELVGAQQVVIKPLSGFMKDVRGAAGCALLGSGDVAIVLDPRQLLELESCAPREVEPCRKR